MLYASCLYSFFSDAKLQRDFKTKRKMSDRTQTYKIGLSYKGSTEISVFTFIGLPQ